jgi:hypothetical protein
MAPSINSAADAGHPAQWNLNSALPGLAALGAIGGAPDAPGSTDTRARSHQRRANLSVSSRQTMPQVSSPAGRRSDGELIPANACVDWYARGVGGAAAREIKDIPAGIPAPKGSEIMPAGMRSAARLDRTASAGTAAATGPAHRQQQEEPVHERPCRHLALRARRLEGSRRQGAAAAL